MFKKIFPLLRDIAIVIGGNIIYACGVAFFILPGGLITGGTTGIALFIQHLFGVPISTFVLCFNAVMFFLGLFSTWPQICRDNHFVYICISDCT